MATQYVEFEAPSGLALTAKLYIAGSDTAAYTASSVTEATNRKGIYVATFTSVAADTYQLVATSGSTGIASWWGYVEDVNATYQFGQRISTSEIRTELATELARIDVAISTRAAAVSMPTAEEIADEVRVELTTELARIDVPISSRLAANAVPPQSGIAEGADSCGMNITTFYGETRTISLALFDSNGDPYDFTGLTLRLCIKNNNKVNLEVFEQGDLTIVDNIITFETSVANDVVGQHLWSLRSLPDDIVLAQGFYNVRKAALA